MSFGKTPAGTRGTRLASAGRPVARWIGNQMIRRARRKQDGKFMDMNVLVLTTVGAKTGQRRETLLGSFPDGDGAWLIVASVGGSARSGSRAAGRTRPRSRSAAGSSRSRRPS